MTHDTQVLLAIGVTAVVGFVLMAFVVDPIWKYVSEIWEYHAGAWRGEWSESRRLEILRYKRDQAIHYPASFCSFVLGGGALIQFIRILRGVEGELGILACLVIAFFVCLHLIDKFDPYRR